MKCRDNMLNKLLKLLLIGIIGLSQVNAQNVLANKEGRTVNVKESERDSMKEYYKTFLVEIIKYWLLIKTPMM